MTLSITSYFGVPYVNKFKQIAEFEKKIKPHACKISHQNQKYFKWNHLICKKDETFNVYVFKKL